MTPPKKSYRSKITRLRAQTQAIRCVNGFVLCLFGLSVGALALASALPQMRQLEDKELELMRVHEKEREVLANKQDAQATYDAIKNDQEYLELIARDRLNLLKQEEKILRIEKDR